jgi:hypothetical protein
VNGNIAAKPSHFTLGIRPQYPLNRKELGPKGWSGHFGEENNLCVMNQPNFSVVQITF